MTQKERVIRAGLNRQLFLLFQTKVVMCASARLTLERSIKNHPEAVGVIEELAWFVGNADWHKYRSTERNIELMNARTQI